MHTCIHTCIPTYLPTYVRTYIPTYLPTYIHTDIHTDRQTHTYTHTLIPIHTITLNYITLLYFPFTFIFTFAFTFHLHYLTLHYCCIALHYITFHSIALHTYMCIRHMQLQECHFFSPIRTDKVSPLCVRCRHPWRYMCSALVEACWQSLNPSWVAFLVSGVVSQWNMVST